MCQACATEYAITHARANLGFEGGTQITKIQNRKEESDNITGFRGVYFECKTRKYRAKLKFRGKLYNFGSYYRLEGAVKARRRGEEEVYDKYLEERERLKSGSDPE